MLNSKLLYEREYLYGESAAAKLAHLYGNIEAKTFFRICSAFFTVSSSTFLDYGFIQF
jgi:hypothetical protein